MNSLTLCGVALLVCVLLRVMQNYASSFVPVLRIGATLFFFFAVLLLLSPVFTYLSALAERTNLEAESSLLLKIFGISALIAFCGDLCRDLGESALANQLELLGRAEVLILLLPTLQKILAFSWELLT